MILESRTLQNPGSDAAAAATADRDLYAGQLAALGASWQDLPDKPSETPVSTLHSLWLLAAGAPGIVIDDPADLPPLSELQARRLEELVRRRASGVPLAHLVGRQRFLGLHLRADPRAMIPRVETELLAMAALEVLGEVVRARGGGHAIDLCTGAGNVAVALAHYLPECEVVAVDLSESAVELARENAELFAVHTRVRFLVGDLFLPVAQDPGVPPADVITCNPPYVSSAKVPLMAPEISSFEPRAAFDGGRFGMDLLFRIIAEAPRFLAPEGVLCFEVGTGQGEFIAQRMERGGAYTAIEGLRDAGGEIRVLRARAAHR